MLAQLFSCRKPTNTTISEFRLVDSSAAAERERERERESVMKEFVSDLPREGVALNRFCM